MGEYLPISATDFPQFLSSNSQSHNLQQFCQKLNCHQTPWEASRNIYQAKILVILSSRYVKVNCLVRHSADQCFTYTGGQIQEVKSPLPGHRLAFKWFFKTYRVFKQSARACRYMSPFTEKISLSEKKSYMKVLLFLSDVPALEGFSLTSFISIAGPLGSKDTPPI